MKKFLFILTLTLVAASAGAQREYLDVKRGNRLYGNKQYDESIVSYKKGIEKNPSSFSGYFNLGNALFRKEQYDSARVRFAAAAGFASDDKLKVAAAYHNIGNSYMMQNDFANAVEAYKVALRNNPKDDETRYNLAFAKSKLKQQQQQQQNQDQNQDQQQQQQQQQQQNKQDQNKQNQDQQNQDQNQDKQDKQQQQQSRNQQDQGMSKEEAEQILQALQQDEKDTQDKKRVKVGDRRRVEKDW